MIALREYAGVGARTFQFLMSVFGSLEGLFASSPGEIAELPRLNDEREEEIRASVENRETVRTRLEEYRSRGIETVTLFDLHYPRILLEMGDPPPYFYYQGHYPIMKDNSVAIVGSHQASEDGIGKAVQLGKRVAASGAVVVSGLAKGIDAAAHLGAISVDGGTVAVLGCGFDEIFPEENRPLAANILEHGLLVSEYPPDTRVSVGRLMARNRVIVGLSQAVVVVEVTNGAGGTAEAIKECRKQRKTLFTCFDPNCEGVLTNAMDAIYLAKEDDWEMITKYLIR